MSQKTTSNEPLVKSTYSNSNSGESKTQGKYHKKPKLTNASVVTLGSYVSYSGKSEMLLKSENFISATKSAESKGYDDYSNVFKTDLPNADHDVVQGRLFLQQKGLNNISVWSHVTEVLRKILSERPLNVIDSFEEYSRRVKEERFIKDDYLRDVYVSPNNLDYSNKLLNLIKSVNVADDMEELVVEEGDEGKPESYQMDIMEAANFFEQAGVGICREELYLVKVSIKKIVQTQNITKPRFWGKIFGTKQNYYIIECELTSEETAKRNEEEEAQEAAEAEEAERKAREEEERLEQIQQEAEEAERRAWEEQEEAEKQAIEAMGVETESESQVPVVKEESEEIKGPDVQRSETEVSISKIDTKRLSRASADEKFVPEAVSIGRISETLGPLEAEVKLPEEMLPEEGHKDEELKKDEKIIEEEDPLLPPLPTPKKLLSYIIPPIPRPVPQETITVPAESIGDGGNKKVYFVCNEPGYEWTELPKVTPAQVVVSRQIKKYFTGDLNSKVTCYPSFPGSEKNYLRAQIARISAATHISPLGFYHFHEEDEEEEIVEEEEQEGRTNFVENPAFEPIPLTDLMDTSMSYWVHHAQYIMKQGRTTWWSARKPTGGEEDEEAEPEEEEKEDEEKEIGPPLLTPLSEDSPYEDMSPWSVRKVSQYIAENCAAIAKSNVWHGAYAFAVGKRFENIYIGWGHKYSSRGFSPVGLPHPEYEYELGPEIMEIADPTVEIEEAWRLAHKKKPPPPPPEEEEEGEGEEEEEEEEDEDE